MRLCRHDERKGCAFPNRAKKHFGGYASTLEAEPREILLELTVSQRLTAHHGGEAARKLALDYLPGALGLQQLAHQRSVDRVAAFLGSDLS